ncbi:MAG: hypothetical protein ACMG5Z_08040 [Luteimonas sp.]
MRILFVGNSYLYTNDMPARVRQLAKRHSVTLDTQLRTAPNYALSDHLREPSFDAVLAQPWDWVILQQGPSSLPESKDDLIASAVAIAARLRDRPTRIALLAAWPAAANAATSPAAEANYRDAAAAIGACVLPVAAAWRLAGEVSELPVLYQIDRLHPNRAGTRLSAMVVVHGLLGAGSTAAGHAAGGGNENAMATIVHAAYAQEPRACAPT